MGNPIYSYLGDGGFDLLISRFSGDGSVRWQKVYRAAFLLDEFHAFETQSGDFLVAGTLTHVPNTDARSDVWILRLDGNGNVRWMKLYGTEGWDAVTVIEELPNGDLLFAGQTDGAGTGNQDMWGIKTNAQGEIPNCSLALGISDWLENSAPAAVSPEAETIALEGVSSIEWDSQEFLFFEDIQQLFDARAQAIPICSPP